MKNRGLNLELELLHQKPTDQLLGGLKKKCVALIPLGQRKYYLPEGEIQNLGEEKMDCVSRAFVNNLETKFNWLLRKNLIPQTHIDFFERYKYITPKGIEFSDAFVSILSETTRQGNSLIKPIHAIHKKGLVPKHLLPQLSTWGEHHDPERITPELLNIGVEFLTLFSIGYERAPESEFKKFLEEDMPVTGGYAWPEPVDGTYQRVEDEANHSYMLFEPAYQAFDNYEEGQADFIKLLASNYKQIDGYRTIIEILSLKKKEPSEYKSWFQKLKDFLNEIFYEYMKRRY